MNVDIGSSLSSVTDVLISAPPGDCQLSVPGNGGKFGVMFILVCLMLMYWFSPDRGCSIISLVLRQPGCRLGI